MELRPEDLKKIDETHDAVIQIKGLLIGEDGSGLCARVDRHESRIHKVELILAFAAGGGGVTGGVLWVMKLLGG